MPPYNGQEVGVLAALARALKDLRMRRPSIGLLSLLQARITDDTTALEASPPCGLESRSLQSSVTNDKLLVAT